MIQILFRIAIIRPGLLLLFFALGFSFFCNAQTVCNPSINITHSPASLCSNQIPSFTAIAFNAGSNPIYQWKKNGIPVGSNSPNYSGLLNVNDVVICELTTTSCPINTTVISNSFVLEPFNEPVPEVTTVASQQLVCAGAIVNFIATNKSGNTNVAYQWIVNGNGIAGTNSTLFSATILTDNTVVECIMTTTTCLMVAGSTKDYSDPIVIRLLPSLKPSITIAAVSPIICMNAPANFVATASDAGNNPLYEWKVNGLTVSTTGSTLNISTLKDKDTVTCRLTVDPASNCNITVSAISNIIVMQVKEMLNPAIAIKATEQEICAGTPVIFTADTSGAGSNPVLQWFLNGQRVGINSITYTTVSLADGDKINCALTTTAGCNTSVITSNSITMIVNKIPVIIINSDSLFVWAGNQVQLYASVTGNILSYSWVPGNQLINTNSLSPFTIPLTENTTYILNVISDKGCQASNEVEIKVYRLLLMSNSFTPNGDGKNDLFRIPPSVPLELNEFSIFDRWGNRIFFTKDISRGWNGSFKDAALDAGVYIYLIRGRYQNKNVTIKGTTLLIK